MAKPKEDKAIVQYREHVSTALAEAERLEVASFEGVMDAADLLYSVKGIGEQIAEKKEAITKPMNEALKNARAMFKPIEEAYATAERTLKDKIVDWHGAEWTAGKQTDNKICGLKGYATVVERHAVDITDAAKIPPQFCSPDTKKIEHALKAGIEVPGAALKTYYDIMAGKN